MAKRSFYEVLRDAVRDITEHGFDSSGRLEYWTSELKKAAEGSLMPLWRMEEMLRSGLGAIYRRLIEREQIAKYHGNIDKYTLTKIAPRLRAELDRRILASANLIKLNREQAIAKTLQRFSGWTTSVPAGGASTATARETAKDVRKSLAQLPFVERRVIIDQGHKLSASLSEIVAQDEGAIAAIWHSHWREAGYNYREDHKERDKAVYTVRGNWALERGFMKSGPDGYTDEITKPAEEPFCRCWYEYIYSIGELPKNMLTKKGAEELARVRKLL